MSHILFIIAQLVPWYLFPGTAPADTSRKQAPVTEPQVVVDTILQKSPAGDSLSVREFVLDIPETINVCLAMPLGGSVPGNIDFYCGAMLAARDLGNEGLSINIHAHDSGKEDIGPGLIATSDVFIGPISFDDVRSISRLCPPDKVTVSPLEQKVSVLTDSMRIVQTPTRHDDQLRELARWASEDMMPETKIILILDGPADSTNVIVQTLNMLGTPFSTVNGTAGIKAAFEKGSEARFIICSDKEQFNSEAIRLVSVLALEKNEVSIYCPSKVRSYSNMKVELLHNSNAHVITNYYVDYNSPEVRNFVYSYRALFKTEPNSFAFHGYDTVKYFTRLCSIFGREWYKRIEEYPAKGLQSDFSFGQTDCGAVNHACRKVVYEKDFTISAR